MHSRRPILPCLVLLLLSGCAETDFMTAGPVSRRVAEGADPRGADQRTTEPRSSTTPFADPRNATLEQRLDQINQRLNQVDDRVDGLAGAVSGAQKRADEAVRKADTVDGRLTRLWTNRFNQKAASSLEVYFSPDSIDLTDAAQTVLVWVAKEMEQYPTLTVELGGYTDARGSVDYNYGLSQRRVDAVRKFLMDKGIQVARIQSASLGPVTNADIPDAKKRRVTLKLLVDRE
ncbi:MAG TPA: OmpA family protein [Methylomirabilota bacterium]|jgi:outer membrane protein OmpA-like peptidoglycan-associated protein